MTYSGIWDLSVLIYKNIKQRKAIFLKEKKNNNKIKQIKQKAEMVHR